MAKNFQSKPLLMIRITTTTTTMMAAINRQVEIKPLSRK